MVKGGGATAAVVKSKVVLVEVYLVVWLFFLVRVFSFLLFCLFFVFCCFYLFCSSGVSQWLFKRA